MTENEKYTVLLNALAEVVKEKDFKLSMKQYEIESLRKRLEQAEAEKEKANAESL